MPIYRIHHVTTYRYRQPVGFGEHRMMLLPREGHDQRLVSSALAISPEPSILRYSDDALGNRIGIARFSGRAHALVFDSEIRVAHQRSHPAGINLEDRARTFPVTFRADELSDLSPFLLQHHPDARETLQQWARGFLQHTHATSTIEFLVAMIHGIRHGLRYVRREEQGIQSPAETLSRGAGTCRDFTELMIGALRSLGLPARFVSGYLYVPARDSHEIHGGGATHAWVQVFLPGAGWLDIDPTNAILGNDGLIRIAVAREPDEALPLSGSYSGLASDALDMEVTVKVVRDDGEEAERPLRRQA